jgi:hypothetical protein
MAARPMSLRSRGLPARAFATTFAAAAVGLLWAAPALGHAVGTPFRSPIPLWMQLAGAGLAVAASFVVSATVVKSRNDDPRYPRFAIALLPSLFLSRLLAVVGMLWWYGAIAAAFLIGGETPIPAIGLWIFVWVGLPIAAELLGNPWPSLSPFRTSFSVLESLARFLGFDRLDLGLVYPTRAGRWPAALLLFAGIWSELVLPGATEAGSVAALMIGYTLVTLVGMACFGRVAWVRNAELFEVLLGWLGRIGPLGRRTVEPSTCAGCGEQCDPDRCVDCPECAVAAEPRERRPEVRPWFAGLTEVRRGAWSDAAFILLALAGVTYDGFRQTAQWADLENGLLSVVQPRLGGFDALLAVGTLGLLGTWLAFLAVFSVGAAITRRLSEEAPARLGWVVGAYAATLLPIAGGYIIAHYLTLLIQGVTWLPDLVQDPFATAPAIEIPTILVWYISVAAIVLGHIAAIFLAHRIALRDAPQQPVRAGVPLAALMVAYTVLSLWIIAQPIVEEPSHAETSSAGVAAATAATAPGG